MLSYIATCYHFHTYKYNFPCISFEMDQVSQDYSGIEMERNKKGKFSTNPIQYFSKDAIGHCPCFCYDFQHFWIGSMWLHVERSVILSRVHVILAFVIRARGSFSFKISFPQAHFKGCWLARSSTLELNFKSLNNSPQSLRYVLTLRISGIFNAFL